MRSRLLRRALRGLLIGIPLACVQEHAHESSVTPATAAPAAERPATAAVGADKNSGYALGKESCGEAPLAFPKIRIDMRAGYCAGLVASKDDGLVMPRSIVQVPDTTKFVVADMGGWNPKQGRLLLLDPEAPEGKRLKVLLTRLDVPHGLAVGIDRRIYASTAERIFRLDPFARQPESTVEVILQGLPGLQPTLSDGTKLTKNFHPLKHFVFDQTGRIYVNIGAPSDSCTKPSASESKPCAAGEGQAPMASVWAFTPPASGIFPALKTGSPNPPREVYARGLRNSMALAVHPQFPAEGFAFVQGENARDLPNPMEPNEELNVLEKGKHYGWPYCYDLTTPSPEYNAFLQTRTQYQRLCTNTAFYKQPYTLMPPHAAPLSMFYYQGEKFPELKGKLIVGLHGYRPTGSRVIFYDVDAKGFPTITAAPVTFKVSCGAEATQAFQTAKEGQVPAAPFHELISGWHKVNGVRPRGAPVGMTVASDGAIWLVEDKNPSIVRIDIDRTAAADPLGCDARSEALIEELLRFVMKGQKNQERLSEVRAKLIEKHCVSCHSQFGLKPGMGDAQKNEAVLRFILRQDGWVYPGDHEAGRLHSRVWGKGAEKVMPENGRDLIKDPNYRRLLNTLDSLVDTTVPGERKRIKVRSAELENRTDRVCGSIPKDALVVVVDKRPSEKAGFSRIFRPADKYLNGNCVDGDGYYIAVSNLANL
jgi:glucose/arabinose dehydrogenase